MDYTTLRKFWPRRIYVEKPKSGDCVVEWEYNGYDDSDFYAVVWDGEGFSVVETGSTRYCGGSILSAKADEITKQAFDEVLEEWRKYMVQQLVCARKAQLRACRIPDADIDPLVECVFGESKKIWEPIIKLLGTKKFRSEFRENLARQVREWLHTPVADRRYQFPLTPRQLDCIYRPRPF